jgi:hypothetical protein
MRLELVYATAFLLNALGLSVESHRLSVWLLVFAALVYGFATGWWAYGKYHGVF